MAAVNNTADMYNVTSYSEDIDLNFINNYVGGWVIPLGDVKSFSKKSKSGKQIYGQSLVVLADRVGVSGIKRYCALKRVNFYIPSVKSGDAAHTLFVPMHCLTDFLTKTYATNGKSIDACTSVVHNCLADKMKLLVGCGIISPATFDISVKVRAGEKDVTAFGFINFKETLDTWYVGMVRAYLNNHHWDILPCEFLEPIKSRINKVVV